MNIFDKALHNRIRELKDVKEDNRSDMIKSVLDTPCIKLSFEDISKNPVISRLIDFTKLTKEEFEKNYAFSPNDFIYFVTNDEEYLKKAVHEMNIKAIYRKCYEAYVLFPDDIEFDLFRARAKQEYDDCKELNDEQETSETQNKSKTQEPEKTKKPKTQEPEKQELETQETSKENTIRGGKKDLSGTN